MRTYILTPNHKANEDGTNRDDSQSAKTKLEVNKEQWLQQYSLRLFKLWTQWKTPLGVANSYAQQIRKDLAKFYQDPLKRRFIENTYGRVTLTQ
jgi:hypothetical protein